MSSYTFQRSGMTSISLDMHYNFKFSANPYLAVALLLLNTWHIVFPAIPFHQPCQISAFSKPNNETYRCSVSKMVKAQNGTVPDRDQTDSAVVYNIPVVLQAN